MVLRLVFHVSKQHTGSTTQILLNSTGLSQILVVRQCLTYIRDSVKSPNWSRQGKAALCSAFTDADRSQIRQVKMFYLRLIKDHNILQAIFLFEICSFDENENRSISIC